MLKFLSARKNFWSEQTVCPRKSVVKTPICSAEDNHSRASLCGLAAKREKGGSLRLK